MFKSVKNNKGFTLIELLAVIVIMGVLMMVAVPAVTKYIERSKKDAYVDTAKSYINSARYMLLNDEFDCNIPTLTTEGSIYIDFTTVDIDQGGGTSPYNKKFKTGYIKVTGQGSNAASPKSVYSIAMVDAGENGIASYTDEKDLDRNSIKKGGVNAVSKPESVCAKRTS